jgi:hypothetical protein
MAKRRSEHYKQVKKVVDKARRELKRDDPNGPASAFLIRSGVLHHAHRALLGALPLIEGREWDGDEVAALQGYIREIVRGSEMIVLEAPDTEAAELFELEATATAQIAALCGLAFAGHTGFERELEGIEECRQWGPDGKPDDYIEEPEDLKRITGWLSLLNTMAQNKRDQGWSEGRIQKWVAEREREHEERRRRREEEHD